MMYAKYIDGHLEYAPRVIKTSKTITYNPTGEMLIQLGYKPIYEEEEPEYYCEPRYSETEEAIIIQWEAVEETEENEEI